MMPFPFFQSNQSHSDLTDSADMLPKILTTVAFRIVLFQGFGAIRASQLLQMSLKCHNQAVLERIHMCAADVTFQEH